MTPKEKLISILNEKYISEDKDEYQVELLEGLTEDKIHKLAEIFPLKHIPFEIKELLKFARGFKFHGFEEIKFDGLSPFGFEEFFPHSIQLTGDGFGNFWILDVNKNGNWGNVFFVCHDPAVIIKHSENLTEFIEHIDDFGKNQQKSHIDKIHDNIVWEIWNKTEYFIDGVTAKNSNDLILKNFALKLPEDFIIADLRNKPIQSGFAWGKFGPNIDKTIRHETELIWAIEKKVKKSFFSKLLGK